jgi:hypothetical protein
VDESLLELLTHAAPPLQQRQGVEQQVVEIDCIGLAQDLLIRGVDARDRFVPPADRLLGKELGRHRPGLGAPDRPEHGRGTECRRIEVAGGDRLARNLLRIVRIVDGEGRREPDRCPPDPQDACARRVEGADPARLTPGVAGDALAHLACGLVRERDCEDPARIDAVVLDQRGDPTGDDAGLARSRPGQHQERTAAVAHSLALLGVEIVADGAHRPSIGQVRTRRGARKRGAGALTRAAG